MLSHKQALKLLKKHGIAGGVLNHCVAVNIFVVELAKKLKNSGEKININLIDVASLLHDIGELASDNSGKCHVEEGANILIEEGYPKIAKIIEKHKINFILDENKKPRTWEEKIVYYADKRVISGTPISLEERFENWKKKHSDIETLKKKILPKIKEIEKEIMEKINV